MSGTAQKALIQMVEEVAQHGMNVHIYNRDINLQYLTFIFS